MAALTELGSIGLIVLVIFHESYSLSCSGAETLWILSY